jgi:hypothetical protein
MENVFIRSSYSPIISDTLKAIFVLYLNNVNKLNLIDVSFADMNYAENYKLNPISTIFDISKIKE